MQSIYEIGLFDKRIYVGQLKLRLRSAASHDIDKLSSPLHLPLFLLFLLQRPVPHSIVFIYFEIWQTRIHCYNQA